MKAANPIQGFGHNTIRRAVCGDKLTTCAPFSTFSGCCSLGFGSWLGYALAGLVMFLLIITIPFGIASFRLAAYVLWPFGRTVINNLRRRRGLLDRQRDLVPTRRCLDGNRPLDAWGDSLPHRRWDSARPRELQTGCTIAPLGKEIVRTTDPRAAVGTVSLSGTDDQGLVGTQGINEAM